MTLASFIVIFTTLIFKDYIFKFNIRPKNTLNKKLVKLKNILTLMRKNIISEIDEDIFINQLVYKELLNSIFPNHNITIENEIRFYKMLNENILSGNKDIFDVVDNIKFELNITNKQIENQFENKIKLKSNDLEIKNKINQFENIKSKYFNLFKDIANDDSMYSKINNHLLNKPYDAELDKMLDEFLNNSKYFEILDRYGYLVKVADLYEDKINDDEISMFDKIQEKFNNDDRNILNDIRTLTLKIEEKD